MIPFMEDLVPVEISVESESLLGFLAMADTFDFAYMLVIRPASIQYRSPPSNQRRRCVRYDRIFPRIASHKKDEVGWRMRELSCSNIPDD